MTCRARLADGDVALHSCGEPDEHTLHRCRGCSKTWTDQPATTEEKPVSRPDSPDVRDPEKPGVVTIVVKRSCNGCGRKLGDATQEELSALFAQRPLPDVREECGCLTVPPERSRFGVTAARPIRPEDGPEDPDMRGDYRGLLIGQERRALDVDDDGYGVYLPHSCDEWVIGAGRDREQVLAAAREFRAELDAAISALEAAP